MLYLIVSRVSCLFLPCKAVQEEKETHWLEPEHTLSTLVITTDLPDLITDAEIALLVTQQRNTNCLHIFSITDLLGCSNAQRIVLN